MSRLIVFSLVAAFAVSLSAQVPGQPAAAAHKADNRVLVVARTTAAINYRLLSGDMKVDLLGTSGPAPFGWSSNSPASLPLPTSQRRFGEVPPSFSVARCCAWRRS
jgi:hypothetical protein